MWNKVGSYRFFLKIEVCSKRKTKHLTFTDNWFQVFLFTLKGGFFQWVHETGSNRPLVVTTIRAWNATTIVTFNVNFWANPTTDIRNLKMKNRIKFVLKTQTLAIEKNEILVSIFPQKQRNFNTLLKRKINHLKNEIRKKMSY